MFAGVWRGRNFVYYGQTIWQYRDIFGTKTKGIAANLSAIRAILATNLEQEKGHIAVKNPPFEGGFFISKTISNQL